jgi:tRNA(Ile)-lysidine synthetase-like protein
MRQIIQLTKFYPPLYPFFTFLKHYLCPVLKIVQKQLKALLEIHPQAHFLLANSGGVDSMVLFHLLLKTGCPFSVAHCNFGLRGAVSDGDENFIIALCHKHQITVHTKNFATKAYANTNGVSIQMAARELRYEWFETLKNQHNFSHLLTAHHLDDQLETFMINVGRGSGLKGLRGIRSETIVRPLPPFSKAMIVDYAKANAIEWREDASNASANGGKYVFHLLIRYMQKWNIHNEVQYRNYNAIGDLEQLLLRTGIGYNLTENNNNLLLGYGYILSENYAQNGRDKFDVNEHRIFQQFTTKQKLGRVGLSHRYRFEQRFVEDDFKMRFRYFLSLNIPLAKKEVENPKYYLSAYNEIFLNTKSSIFDRNRVYGGIGYKLNANIRIEAGYMNQFFETSSRDQFNLITFVNF